MILKLTAAQAAEIAPHMRLGTVMLGRITREPYDGANPSTCGTLEIEFGGVPEGSLANLREAIRLATAPAAPTKRKAKI